VFHTIYSGIFHPCYLLLLFPLLHSPPLLSTPAFSTPAFSTLAILTVSHFPLPHFQSPRSEARVLRSFTVYYASSNHAAGNAGSVILAFVSGVASYGTLEHVPPPPPSTSNNFIFSSLRSKSESQLYPSIV